MFYLADFLKIQAQKAASQIALRDFSKEVSEETVRVAAFATKPR